MTGISDVSIRYIKRYIDGDDDFYCDMLISGNTTTPFLGRYSIVRRVVDSGKVYPMYEFDSATSEREHFELRTTINISGDSPNTDELTEIYVEQDGVQQGDAYRFTVERCRTDYEELVWLGTGLGGIIFAGYVLYKLTIWSSDTKKYSYE